MNKNRGFTLIELVIVIAIIGVIAAAVLSAINPFENQKISRDTVRVSSLTSLAQALELYFSENKSYPENIAGTTPGSVSAALLKYNSRLTLNDSSNCEYRYVYFPTDNSFVLYAVSEATNFKAPKGQSVVEVASLPSGLSGIQCDGAIHEGNYLIVKSN